ncbi:uncharacterized protein BKCO1_6700034 [Diplodia corticola]|uniref:Uncharacterized protein n=1 Tax=Diplodia corticola TaxID=236234 RepID=A0A1J9QMD0_9PEZI|nr:uncharacterized protein BKCO1_6700034 [Diplodia corticola]OJD30046.1 hypothetical protein BKCO1_6700034 [Diplodia corticola]
MPKRTQEPQFPQLDTPQKVRIRSAVEYGEHLARTGREHSKAEAFRFCGTSASTGYRALADEHPRTHHSIEEHRGKAAKLSQKDIWHVKAMLQEHD